MPPAVVKPGDWKDDRNGQRVWVPVIGLGEGGGHRSPRTYDPSVARRFLSHSMGGPGASSSRSAPPSPAASGPPGAPRNPRDAWRQLHRGSSEHMQKQSYYGAGASSGGGHYSESYGNPYSQSYPQQNYGGYQNYDYGGSSSSYAYGARQQYSSPQPYRSYGPGSTPQFQHQQMEYGRPSYGTPGGYSVANTFLRPLAPYAPPRGPRGTVQSGNTIRGPPPPQRGSYYGGHF